MQPGAERTFGLIISNRMLHVCSHWFGFHNTAVRLIPIKCTKWQLKYMQRSSTYGNIPCFSQLDSQMPSNFLIFFYCVSVNISKSLLFPKRVSTYNIFHCDTLPKDIGLSATGENKNHDFCITCALPSN